MVKLMIEQQELIFSFEKNLNNSKYTYCKLIELYHTLNSLDQQRVILDLSNITFLSANLLAVLGCCVEYTMAKRNHNNHHKFERYSIVFFKSKQ